MCKGRLCLKFTHVSFQKKKITPALQDHQCPYRMNACLSGSDKAGTILMIQLSVPLINAGCRFCPLRRQDADTSDRLVPCGFLDERWQRARVKKREASGREKKREASPRAVGSGRRLPGSGSAPAAALARCGACHAPSCLCLVGGILTTN